METRSGTQPKYPEIHGINMENKGHVVYLMAIPSNTSRAVLMSTSSPALEVVMVGGAGTMNASVGQSVAGMLWTPSPSAWGRRWSWSLPRSQLPAMASLHAPFRGFTWTAADGSMRHGGADRRTTEPMTSLPSKSGHDRATGGRGRLVVALVA